MIKRVIAVLIQFNFKNFKSFRDDTTLDMTAASAKEHQYNLVETIYGERLLKTAAIYGANASGKSSLIEAFDFMRLFVTKSFEIGLMNKRIPVKRFLFNDESKSDVAEFEVFFIEDNIEYQYGFILDNERIYQEWLYGKYDRGEDFEVLFERDGSYIQCGDRLKNSEKFIDLVEEYTLFLSFIARTKIEEAKKIFRWFVFTDVINFGNVMLESIITREIPGDKFRDEYYRERCEEFLSAIDTGICGIRVEEGKTAFRVYSKHRIDNTNTYVEIPLSEESSGTQKMFFLFDFFMAAMREGSTLFIDELDAKLHPLLLRYIVNMFHDNSINKNNAQLIYTTHDNYTLTKDIFRRDQIWFVEKDSRGISKLYSLVEYKLEEDSKHADTISYGSDYLLGRYGAVPLLKEFKLLEEDKNGQC
jgi:AAA15 family ATPase/GTPase